MHNQKLLAEFVAELNDILHEHPGINCIVENNDFSSSMPSVDVKLVYTNEHEHYTIVDDWQIENVKSIVNDYTKNSAEQMWENTDKEDYEDFDHFKADYEMVKSGNMKELEMIKGAVLTVVIS
jgi:hypothetical protein